MGGPACWKEIIDRFNALQQQVSCMAESIRIAGSALPEASGIMPTYEQRDAFFKACEGVAAVAADIQKHVSSG
jgi:hypothetical protein